MFLVRNLYAPTPLTQEDTNPLLIVTMSYKITTKKTYAYREKQLELPPADPPYEFFWIHRWR